MLSTANLINPEQHMVDQMSTFSVVVPRRGGGGWGLTGLIIIKKKHKEM